MHAAGDKTNWLNGGQSWAPRQSSINQPSLPRSQHRDQAIRVGVQLFPNPAILSMWGLNNKNNNNNSNNNNYIYMCIYIYIYVYIIYYKVFKSRVIQWFLPGMGCRSLGLRAWPKLALIGLWAIARHGSVEWDENSMAQLDNHQYITYINGSIMIYLIINGI